MHSSAFPGFSTAFFIFQGEGATIFKRSQGFDRDVHFFERKDQGFLFSRKKKPLREREQALMVVLKYRNPIKAIFWSWNSPVGWLPDTKSKGTGFDSRSCRGDFFTFWGCLGMCLGLLWGCFRTVLKKF